MSIARCEEEACVAWALLKLRAPQVIYAISTIMYFNVKLNCLMERQHNQHFALLHNDHNRDNRWCCREQYRVMNASP